MEGGDEGNGIGQFANDLINERNNFILDAAICKRAVGDPLDPNGLQTIDVPCPRFYKQDGIAHEIGHLIGLPQVGVARRGHACLKAMSDDPLNGVNSHACYREPSYDDADNIMGMLWLFFGQPFPAISPCCLTSSEPKETHCRQNFDLLCKRLSSLSGEISTKTA